MAIPHLDPSLLLRPEPNNLIGKLRNTFVIWGTSSSIVSTSKLVVLGPRVQGLECELLAFAWNLDYLIGVDFHHKADEAPLVVMQWKALLSEHYMLDLGSPFYFCDGGFIGKISLLSADQVLGLNWQPIFDHLNLEFQILHYISLANYPHSPPNHVSIKRSNDRCNLFFGNAQFSKVVS